MIETIKVKKLRPTVCNICGGKVEYIQNKEIYGRSYGSGFCYWCSECGAYVGTHKVAPKEALGILANEEMRQMKMKCHDIFDKMWNTPNQRRNLYKWLAKELKIHVEDCHFGYFDLSMLNKALKILQSQSIVKG